MLNRKLKKKLKRMLIGTKRIPKRLSNKHKRKNKKKKRQLRMLKLLTQPASKHQKKMDKHKKKLNQVVKRLILFLTNMMLKWRKLMRTLKKSTPNQPRIQFNLKKYGEKLSQTLRKRWQIGWWNAKRLPKNREKWRKHKKN